MAKGFFAELQRQAARSARESERAHKASVRAHTTAVREYEAAQKREQQARIRFQKASVAEQKRLEKEAKLSHEEAMQAHVDSLNSNLAGIDEELSGILAGTLDVDDFVDLETFRAKTEHPPFDRPDLLTNARPPLPIIDPPMPLLVEPPAPRGIMSILGKKLHQKKTIGSWGKTRSGHGSLANHN